MSLGVKEVDERTSAPSGSVGAGKAAALAGAGLLLLGGALLRVHLLVSQPIDGDQSVAGMMAVQVLHGHFYTFFWGNQYAGGEFYLEAVMFALFGPSPVVLNATGVAVTAAAAVVLWRCALRVVAADRRWLAAVVAGVFWVWPEAAVWNSAREFGFRQLTMLAGIAAILLAQRLVEDRSLRAAVGLGLALGVDLWTSPEVVYFAVVPIFMILVAARHRQTRIPVRALAGVAAGGLVGATPWIWTNLRTGFASLHQTGGGGTYTGRLSLFFRVTFPMMLGLRRPVSGAWLWAGVGPALYALALVTLSASCLLCLRRVRRNRRGLSAAAVAVALVLFPFEHAAFKATIFWRDGHYGVFVVPLTLLVVAAAVPDRLRRPEALAAAVAAAVAVAVAVTLVAFDGQFLASRGLQGLVEASSDPNAAALAAVGGLRANGIRFAYANYWVAYDLDFLSGGKLAVTDPAVDRWAPLYREVRTSADPAWIFYNPAQRLGAEAQFRSTAPGPFSFTETLFTRRLDQLGVSYRIVPLGVLDAVLTSRAVRQEEVGMGPPMIP